MEFIKKVLKSKIKSLKQDIAEYETKAKNDPEHEFIYICWKDAKESELEYMQFLLDIAEREERYNEIENENELEAEDERVAGEIYDMANEYHYDELCAWIDMHYLNGQRK